MHRTKLALLAAGLLFMASAVELRAQTGSETWSYGTPLPSPARTAAAGASLGERLYVLGGRDARGRTLSTAEAYDPQSDRWISLPALQPARQNAVAVAYDGHVCVLGGRERDGDVSDEVKCYSPETNRWTSLGDLATEREGLGAAVIDGQLYAFGGADEEGEILRSIERYDAASREWEVLSVGLPVPVVSFGTAVADGVAYLVGGYTPIGEVVPVSFIQSFAPASGSAAVELASFGQERGSVAAAARDGVIYIIGGSTQSGAEDDVFTYDPSERRLGQGPSLQTARASASAALLGGSLFVIGGHGSDDAPVPLSESVERLVVGTALAEEEEGSPLRIEAAPNPFSGRTRIGFMVGRDAALPLLLSVYDLSGRRIKTLAEGRFAPGAHAAEWDGMDEQRRPVPSGLYLLELKHGRHRVVSAVTVVR